MIAVWNQLADWTKSLTVGLCVATFVVGTGAIVVNSIEARNASESNHAILVKVNRTLVLLRSNHKAALLIEKDRGLLEEICHVLPGCKVPTP